MGEWLGFGSDLPWWGWALLAIGVVAIVSVIGALFLPDWPNDDYTVGFEADPGSESFVEWSAAFLNNPAFQGGEVTLLENGDAFFPAILNAIKQARDNINFEVYIFEPDEIGRQFIDAFKERAAAGVEVRLLLDGFGAMKLRKRYRDELRQAGVRISRFRPFSLRSLPRFYRRSHRRAIVIDGRVGFTGGAAVSAKWKGNVRNAHEWRDSMTRVTGPLVSGIQSAFAGNWVYCTGEVIAGPRFFPRLDRGEGPCSLSVVSSPSDALQPIRLLLWLSFINARRRLWICNSYFIPDRRLRVAVIERSRAGVDVRILVPGNHTDALPVQAAGRSYYEELLAAGIRIFEYQPAMMHAKTVVVDGAWSVVGSANLDERSMELNEENVLGIADRDFARAVEEGVVADLERSREIHLDEWRKRPIYKKVLERAAKALIEQY
ncbi:MAG TPA: phospholipase D-like domain-containing protein [Gemmatimonadales bacterium]|jgi:cardiolipin synthase|nr:phospholipase D-like domain-containing protein [Gemmatimonadales bacterium]